MRLTDMQDAFGHEIHDYHTRKTGFEIVERDDGYFDVSTGPAAYFLEYNSWSESERKAMKHAQGHILDIGCGAGRHAIYLQSKGFTVTGIDTSPLAVHVCKARGLQDVRVMPITKISRK
ncbi:methyltransferase domain-containing protein, partial [bacterium]|nr:methyltransferase domain-containing protein [candidate division CSSED10-310 bacterium]